MVLGVHHAGVTVADLERSLALYRDLLGLEVVLAYERTEPDIGRIVGYPDCRIRIAFLQAPGDSARLELLQYLNPEGTPRSYESRDPGTGHVCFRVEDIHGIHARLVAAGYRCRSEEPVEITQGPNRGAFALYFRDPDGYTVELIQPPP
jgi:lactoylglutathione lyase